MNIGAFREEKKLVEFFRLFKSHLHVYVETTQKVLTNVWPPVEVVHLTFIFSFDFVSFFFIYLCFGNILPSPGVTTFKVL